MEMKFSQLFLKTQKWKKLIKVIQYGVSITFFFTFFFFKSSEVFKYLLIWPHHETQRILIP